MPAQTRGFLFSDLRDYSAFVERHGDRAARELLTRYRRLVRETIAQYGGAEIRTEGDSFYVVFDSVSQAVEAGLAVQAALAADTDGQPVRAGIGIHAGEVEDDAEHGIVSGAVNIAARLCAVAGPGEVLVSDTVHGLTRGYLDVAFVPRGRRRLKGISAPVAVYRVTGAKSASRMTRWDIGGLGRWPLVAALGVSALILAAALGAVMTGPPGPSRTGHSPGPSAASARAEATASTSPPSRTAAGLDADQQASLAYIAPARRDACGPALAEDGPRFRDVQGLAFDEMRSAPFAYMATVGGIHCQFPRSSGPTGLWIWELRQLNNPSSPQSSDEWMASHAGQVDAPPGECTEDSVPALETWTFSGRNGQLLCFMSVAGDAIVYWTYQGRDILGKAIRDDRDMGALLDWWRSEARLAGG